ncbi:MAG TPA: pilus assembly protein [Verrucomicrobiota bacterium]|nr:pilus assembly protein [Verrucomicrobiota bacterium]HRZ35728.1 pilus assembly protein [Candidatus Paceibacterota bacterium]HRZ58134.1 pilus assembly protein [Candidatus Paceibacterota bacterium]
MIYLVDTGPLVSAFARRETAFKRWAEALLVTLPLPLVTCEPVVTEAAHMLGSGDRLLEAMHRGLLVCRFDLQANADSVRQLCARYASLPMDLADACLVQLYETYRAGTATIVTVDREDFSVYRAHRNQPLLCEFPPTG